MGVTFSQLSFTTVGGWAGLVLFAGGYMWLSQRSARRANLRAGRRQTRHTESQKTDKTEKARAKRAQADKTTASSAESASDKPKKAVQSYTTPNTQAGDNDSADDLDARQFAAALKKAQAGTDLKPKQESRSQTKSVKQSHAQEGAPVKTKKANKAVVASDVSAPSSNAGGDADDEAMISPDFAATVVPDIPVTGDVSDMLEAATPGPSVLRVTAPIKPVQARPQQKKKVEEAAETKKQRQNRQKAEAAKIAREEQEKERRVLMEKQRRLAREAEGRAAKDGSTFMAAQAPKTSAWKEPTQAENSQPAVKADAELLDTLDTAASAKTPTTTLPTTTGTNSTYWEAMDLPTEEEQMQRLRDDEAWNTVTSKKKKKKGKAAGGRGTSPEDSQSEDKKKNVKAAGGRATSSKNSQSAGQKENAKPTGGLLPSPEDSTQSEDGWERVAKPGVPKAAEEETIDWD